MGSSSSSFSTLSDVFVRMAWLGGVFADASVGTVGTTVSGWGAVDLGVANDQFVRVVGQSFETALVNALTGNGAGPCVVWHARCGQSHPCAGQKGHVSRHTVLDRHVTSHLTTMLEMNKQIDLPIPPKVTRWYLRSRHHDASVIMGRLQCGTRGRRFVASCTITTVTVVKPVAVHSKTRD